MSATMERRKVAGICFDADVVRWLREEKRRTDASFSRIVNHLVRAGIEKQGESQ